MSELVAALERGSDWWEARFGRQPAIVGYAGGVAIGLVIVNLLS